MNHTYPVDAYRSKNKPHLVVPLWSTCRQVEFVRPVFALRRARFLDEHVGARQGVSDPPASDVKVFRLDFNARKFATEIDGGNAARSGTHERVKNGFGRAFLDQVFHEAFGLFVGVTAPHRGSRNDPMALDNPFIARAAPARAADENKLKTSFPREGKVAHAACWAFVPNERSARIHGRILLFGTKAKPIAVMPCEHRVPGVHVGIERNLLPHPARRCGARDVVALKINSIGRVSHERARARQNRQQIATIPHMECHAFRQSFRACLQHLVPVCVNRIGMR